MKRTLLLLTGFLSALTGYCQIKLPGLFGDHMVIQRSAKALLENNKVVVYASEVISPVSVRYARADDNSDANLYNFEDFPAVPFRTDQWKGITEGKHYEIGKP